jgi:hypothetical protein
VIFIAAGLAAAFVTVALTRAAQAGDQYAGRTERPLPPHPKDIP